MVPAGNGPYKDLIRPFWIGYLKINGTKSATPC